jgi:competence protein ComEA
VLTFPLTVPQRRLAAGALACLVAGIIVLHHHGPGSTAPLRVAPIRGAAQAGAQATAQPARRSIVVDVVGAIRRPGLYHLAPGARVADAVARAGGLTRQAERSAVNLAAPVSDGQQVLVAAHGSAGGGAAGVGAGAAASGPVSLSTATPEQLDALPGIGPVTAQKIVAFRQEHGPFTSVEGLDAIPGIGPARIAELDGLVVP